METLAAAVATGKQMSSSSSSTAPISDIQVLSSALIHQWGFTHACFSNQERISNDQRDVHPPQLVVVKFGEEDVVVCSDGTNAGINVDGTLTEGPETDWD